MPYCNAIYSVLRHAGILPCNVYMTSYAEPVIYSLASCCMPACSCANVQQNAKVIRLGCLNSRLLIHVLTCAWHTKPARATNSLLISHQLACRRATSIIDVPTHHVFNLYRCYGPGWHTVPSRGNDKRLEDSLGTYEASELQPAPAVRAYLAFHASEVSST